jgi:hypothetical protein
MSLSHQTMDAEQLLAEYDQVSSEISALEHLLAGLRMRRIAVETALDELTTPQKPRPGTSSKESGPAGYSYRGAFTPARDKISIYLGVLRHLLADFPNKADEIASALRAGGRRRRYLARNLSELNLGKSVAWVREHSANLGNGWFADKNLGQDRMEKNLRRALAAVGLQIASDVRIRWESTHPSISGESETPPECMRPWERPRRTDRGCSEMPAQGSLAHMPIAP